VAFFVLLAFFAGRPDASAVAPRQSEQQQSAPDTSTPPAVPQQVVPRDRRGFGRGGRMLPPDGGGAPDATPAPSQDDGLPS
jgi:hypothetical protein